MKRLILRNSRRLRTHQTKAERAFWRLVRRKCYRGLHFGRQRVIRHDGRHTGGEHYIVDFYCARYRLCVEVDGGYHGGAEQARYDAARTVALEEMGYRVLRMSNAFVLGAGEGEVYGVMDDFLGLGEV